MLATIAAVCVGCNAGDDAPEYQYQSRLVKQAFLNSEITIYDGKEIEIQGIGFVVGDKVIFRTAEGDYTATITYVEDTSAIFLAPDMPQGVYTLYIGRGEKTQKVANITVWTTLSVEIPEKDGCSLRGIVYTQVKDATSGEEVQMTNVGVEGVWVSDGVNFTQTDENGYYWLESDKRFGYVFVCLPSGYLPATGSNAVPGFWKAVSIDPHLSEQCNFELKASDTTDHQVFFATDLHLANRSVGDNAINDLTMFREGFIKDSKALAEIYGSNTFLVTMGDLTWDAHWYKTSFMPEQYVKEMKDYPLVTFNGMGNHDNNPYVQGDNLGSKIYRTTIAPTYYSFDLGNVHYIILDDIEWINTNGTNGFVGERNYYERVDDTQLAWLQEDLSHVADKNNPVVVCSHSQLYANWNANRNPTKYLQNADKVLDCFNGFSNVHFMTGHAHYNMTMELRDNVIEHNVGAICETWWQSSAASMLDGRGINRDGTPAGYSVFEFKGGDLKWYYKSIGFDKSLQFRAYDMNNVLQTAKRWDTYLSKQTEQERENDGVDYKDLDDNVIYINVWDYDSKWKIEVWEDGTPLTVTRTFDRDPLHTLTTDLPLAKSGNLVASNASTKTPHMWMVTTKEDDTDISIKVTNRFGEEFTHEMTGRKKRNSFEISTYIK